MTGRVYEMVKVEKLDEYAHKIAELSAQVERMELTLKAIKVCTEEFDQGYEKVALQIIKKYSELELGEYQYGGEIKE